MTSQPSLSSRSTRWLPMNPRPPVTRALLIETGLSRRLIINESGGGTGPRRVSQHFGLARKSCQALSNSAMVSSLLLLKGICLRIFEGIVMTWAPAAIAVATSSGVLMLPTISLAGYALFLRRRDVVPDYLDGVLSCLLRPVVEERDVGRSGLRGKDRAGCRSSSRSCSS